MLGQQLNNPYTVGNMQLAYYNLYGNSNGVQATHLYVRFKPANVEQLQTLLSNDSLELQDYPMDYEVVQDGDYWQDPALGTEDIGWLYTAVPVGYTPPAGITYQQLEQLHIPNNNLLVEQMAESQAAGAVYRSSTTGDTHKVQRTDVEGIGPIITPSLLPGNCAETPCLAGCQPIENPNPPDCSGGPGENGGNNNPPASKRPRGHIRVQDIITCATQPTPVPLRQVRVVCKRWFKIHRSYTDNQGEFVSAKKYNNRVKIIYKTTNDYARVSKIRGIRLWQILFPVKKRIGIFDEGTMNVLEHVVEKPASASAHNKELPYWVAATTHNSVLEYRQYAQEMGVGLPPANLKLLVTNWSFQQDAGAAPMWGKCGIVPQELNSMDDYIRFFIALETYVSSYTSLSAVLKSEIDVIIGYASGNYGCNGLNSPHLKQIAYHELGHTSHFAQASCAYWQEYRAQIVKELAFGNPATRPYGDGTETHAGVVGLGEMWGNHCQYIFTNRHYGNGGNAPDYEAFIQQRVFRNNTGPTPNAYLNAIEDFNPNQVTDVHRWIPQGLPYDLIDNRNDNTFFRFVVDNVAGYTTGQCFNALQPDIRSVPAFRDRLLQQNSNSQQAQIIQLFGEYGY